MGRLPALPCGGLTGHLNVLLQGIRKNLYKFAFDARVHLQDILCKSF
jgi:hypothetical protein